MEDSTLLNYVSFGVLLYFIHNVFNELKGIHAKHKEILNETKTNKQKENTKQTEINYALDEKQKENELIEIKHTGISGFKQIGILKSKTNSTILPLFGKSTLPSTIYHLPYYYGEETWNYYTLSEKNKTMIPLEHGADDCMTDGGCKELKNNDEIFISIYKEYYIVKLYNV